MSKDNLNRQKTKEFFENSKQLIPGGVNSGAQAWGKLDLCPMVVDRGVGAEIIDLEGNSYIDYCGSWGVLIHGHAHPAIVKAAQERVAKGSTFGIHSKEEQPLAKKILEMLPWLEKIRFFSSGTEATMTAARLARGATGKSLIVKFEGNYHGHHDSFLVKAGSGVAQLNSDASSLGVPPSFIQHTLCLPYNDHRALEECFAQRGKEIAGVIFEPVAGNMGVVPIDPSFFQALRRLTKEVGAVLIVDEVITGFRAGIQGAQGLYGIQGDLTCLGKIIGGGFPAAAVAGSTQLMDQLAPIGQVYQAGTLSGNPVAMVAGKQALDLLNREFYRQLEEKCARFFEPLEEAFKKSPFPVCLNRVGSMFTIFWGAREIRDFDEVKRLDWDVFKDYFHFLFERGIYVSPSLFEASFISMAHTEEQLLATQEAILAFLSKVEKRVECFI